MHDLRGGSSLVGTLGNQLSFQTKGKPRFHCGTTSSDLRDQIHKILAQARLEKISLDPQRMLAEAVYAKNIMTSVHGVSPYVALYGRYPSILKEMEDSGLSQMDDSSGTHKHASRLRE